MGSSGRILLPRYIMNRFNDFDKTDREYSPVLTDDLIRFWRSKVRVTAGREVNPYLINYLSNLDETYSE